MSDPTTEARVRSGSLGYSRFEGTPEQAQRIAQELRRDPVTHYMRGGFECIDVMRAITERKHFAEHCRLTAFKYLWRLGEKDDPAREAKKAEDYIRWARESYEQIAVMEPKPETTPGTLTRMQQESNMALERERKLRRRVEELEAQLQKAGESK